MSPAELQQQIAAAHRAFTTGDLPGAMRVLDAVLAAAPDDLNALNLMAGVKRQAGDAMGALAALDKAARLAPHAAPFLFNRANLLLEMERFADAVSAYDAALKLRADHGESHLNRARALEKMQRPAEALASYDQALRLGLAMAQQGRGVCLAALGRDAEALLAFDAALQQAPSNADARFNRARSLQALGRHHDALSEYDRLISVQPHNADVLDNRGVTLHEHDRQDEALAAFDAALRLRPDHAETHTNRGLALFALKRLGEAIAAFDRALALADAIPAARTASLRYNRGAALLAMHDFSGWEGLEARWEAGVVSSAKLGRGEPIWRGEALTGALRIWPEQGIGDEVLFARLAPLARARTALVVLECAPRLAPLFARSFPQLEVRSVDTSAPRADAQIAAGSLGAVMQVGVSALGDGAPYLIAHAEKVAAIRARYDALAAGRPIIGIAWVSKNPKLGQHKSSSLLDWGALLKRDCLFVNLQYGVVGEEIAAAEQLFGCAIHNDLLIDQMADLDSFAAQIAALDHIVSVSNTTVHIAGALSAPCLVMTPPGQGLLWYWGAEGERTPWYRSVRIVRRARGETWAEHIAATAALL